MARPDKEQFRILEKRTEIIFALHHQGWNNSDIGRILNRSRSVISRIVTKIPKDYKPKWIKAS